MIITLTSETAERLRERAERDGQDVDSFTDALLSDALADDPDNLTDKEIADIRAGLRRGMRAAIEGRERPVSDYAAEVRHRRRMRNREADGVA